MSNGRRREEGQGKSRGVRPEVVVAGDLVNAPGLAGELMRREVRVASYVPDYAGGSSGLGIQALTWSASVVVETLDYPIDAKRALIEEIVGAVRPGTLILSSGLAMTAEEIGLALDGYDMLVAFGMLESGVEGAVEIAAPSAADPQAIPRAIQFWKRLRREPIQVADTPGLITPRILAFAINEAAWALGEGVAEAAGLDAAMALGGGYPAGGPLRLADRMGLHRVIAVLQNLQDFTGEERYRPAPLLRRLVLQGRLGAEYGRGFYEYAEPGNGQEGGG